ncbi:MAG TPA: DegT/DnrJ/EryC1/StrS aminotransferase family protein [Pseudolabrys sp.]|nr:DegT/DnrJ/EryC1/StrS aminotransferase family protein [Pseudolabrys sp.]
MIPLMKNAFVREQETKEALAAFIRTAGKLSMGELCQRFEEAFAEAQQCRHAVLVNSGGSANLLLLQALKNLGRLKDGDKVAFTALTWSTNVMPIIQMGLEPVPIDCEVATMNSSARLLLERLEQVDVQAFFITNVLGFAGDLDEIRRVCDERGILLIEDNCESLGTELAGGKTGNFGLAATFSFFVAHHMSTIEGGMLVTEDGELATMLRIARANGWDRNLPATEQVRLRKAHDVNSELYAKYTFYDLGFNMRPTEITGFLGLQQLALLEENIGARQRNFREIEKIIVGHPDFIAIEHGHLSRVSPFCMPFICKSRELFLKYTAAFAESGIEIRPVIAGNMQVQPFYRKYVATDFPVPNTEFIHACGFYCGNYPELTRADLETFKSCLLA